MATKRVKKKRASFEDAFAMALRATFAQDEVRATEPEADSELEAELVAELVADAKGDTGLEAELVEAEAVLSESSEQTTCADEADIQDEQTTCTDEVDIQDEQTLCADETDVQNKLTLRADEMDVQTEPSKCTDETIVQSEPTICAVETDVQPEQTLHTDVTDLQSEPSNCSDETAIPSELPKCADEIDVQTEQSICTDEIDSLPEQTKITYEALVQSEQSTEVQSPSGPHASIHSESLLKIHLRKSLIESKAEHALVAYLQANGNHVSSYALISEETGIPVGTLRRCFKKFIEYELISTAKYCGRGKMQGIIITILNLQAALDNIQITHKSSPKQLAAHTRAGAQNAGQAHAVQIVHWLRRLSDADIATLWPALSAIQFGAKHISQAFEMLQAQGKVFDQKFGEDFKQGLDHADFALGNKGGIKDRHGRTVPKPCDYIYSSLAKDGYYPAPENYVSPQAQRDADEAARLANLGVMG